MDDFHAKFNIERAAHATEEVPLSIMLTMLEGQLRDDRYADVRPALLADFIETLRQYRDEIASFANGLDDLLDELRQPEVDFEVLEAAEAAQVLAEDNLGITVARSTGHDPNTWYVFDGALCVKIEDDERLANEYAAALRNARRAGWLGAQADVITIMNKGGDPVVVAGDREDAEIREQQRKAGEVGTWLATVAPD